MAGYDTFVFKDSAFDQEVLNFPQPVLVDFWAEWCGPYRMMGPTHAQISNAYPGKAKVGHVDVGSKVPSVGR